MTIRWSKYGLLPDLRFQLDEGRRFHGRRAITSSRMRAGVREEWRRRRSRGGHLCWPCRRSPRGWAADWQRSGLACQTRRYISFSYFGLWKRLQTLSVWLWEETSGTRFSSSIPQPIWSFLKYETCSCSSKNCCVFLRMCFSSVNSRKFFFSASLFWLTWGDAIFMEISTNNKYT